MLGPAARRRGEVRRLVPGAHRRPRLRRRASGARHRGAQRDVGLPRAADRRAPGEPGRGPAVADHCTPSSTACGWALDEIKGFVALLLAAGGDTTDKAIANMWYHMLYTRPDQFADVKEDPTLWENVFAEMMRFDPVVHTQTPLHDASEIELHDEVIPKGAMVHHLSRAPATATSGCSTTPTRSTSTATTCTWAARTGRAATGRQAGPPRVRHGPALLHGLRHGPAGSDHRLRA